MSHVFISYSTKDRDYANLLAAKLREEGFNVWIDNANLRNSSDWWKSIVLAIRECAAFIVILTPDSDASEWVQNEITLAQKYKKQRFPLWLEGSLDTPNWEVFVRIQITDVRNGVLPSADFYNDLAEFARVGSSPVWMLPDYFPEPQAIPKKQLPIHLNLPPVSLQRRSQARKLLKRSGVLLAGSCASPV